MKYTLNEQSLSQFQVSDLLCIPNTSDEVIFINNQNNTLVRYNLDTKTVLQSIEWIYDNYLRISPDGKHLLTHMNEYIFVIDVDTLEVIYDQYYEFEFNSSMIGINDTHIYYQDGRMLRKINYLNRERRFINGLFDYNEDPKLYVLKDFIVINGDNTSIYHVNNLTEVIKRMDRVDNVTFSNDNSLMAIIRDNIIRIYETVNFEQIDLLILNDINGIIKIKFHPSLNILFLTYLQNNTSYIKCFDLDKGFENLQIIHVTNEEYVQILEDLEISDNGKYLFVKIYDNRNYTNNIKCYIDDDVIMEVDVEEMFGDIKNAAKII